MTEGDIAFYATIVGAVASTVGAIFTAIGAWHARETNKARGKHRR
ncbi:hypothetical protein ACGF07_32105 [Kitasatospora sp. NPDC048194]